MRPRGELRQAIASEMRALSRPITNRDLARVLGCPEQQVQRTTDNMQRAGELRSVGAQPVLGSRRPLRLYALAPGGGAVRAAAGAGHAALAAAMRAMCFGSAPAQAAAPAFWAGHTSPR